MGSWLPPLPFVGKKLINLLTCGTEGLLGLKVSRTGWATAGLFGYKVVDTLKLSGASTEFIILLPNSPELLIAGQGKISP
jgi:hypothetical protein